MSVFQSCSFVTLALVVAVGWAAHVSKCDPEQKVIAHEGPVQTVVRTGF